MAGRTPSTIAPAPPGTLEAKVQDALPRLAWLDNKALVDLGPVPSRLLGKFVNDDWSKHFDAVIVVREETPAQFEALD